MDIIQLLEKMVHFIQDYTCDANTDGAEVSGNDHQTADCSGTP